MWEQDGDLDFLLNIADISAKKYKVRNDKLLFY
jgi:hypothetical protein